MDSASNASNGISNVSNAARDGGPAAFGLRVHNSLKPGADKCTFFPQRGHQVTWYICGPTVYNVAHVGHARTYLAFDIIRRILEDYFGYNVLYVMNVTDVDDKIIARARGDHLLGEYIASATDPSQVVADVRQALEASILKQEAKVAGLRSTVAGAATPKLREDLEEQAGEEELKLQQRKSAHSVLLESLGPAAVRMAADAREDPSGCTHPPAAGTPAVQLLLGMGPNATELRREKLPGGGLAGEGSMTGPSEGVAGGSTAAEEGSERTARVWEDAVEQCREALAAVLDKQRGGDITDLSIFRRHAARYEREFLDDMGALGVRPPHVLTRVTEYMDVIVEYVRRIVERGFAYESNGSVYFDCRAFTEAGHVYGKLCPWAVDNTERAAESEANFGTSDKRSKSDFALWKASKKGEPYWESPWGPGRPGWHIECSAMASDVIGESIDIHSGGIDLRFPHHCNELAQAEAFHGCHEWVRYFLHTGHLHIEGRKMSKSLKNFITIREALEKYTARQIRMLFLMQAWDKNMNFGEGALTEAAARERQFRIFLQTVQAECRDATSAAAGDATPAQQEAKLTQEEWWGPPEKELNKAVASAEAEVRRCLEDNFDTAGALLGLLGLASATNVYLGAVKAARPQGTAVRPLLLRRAADFVARILSVFGLMEGSNKGDGKAGEGAKGREDLLMPVVQGFSSFRDSVREAAIRNAPKEELLALTDRVRDYAMVDLGIRCEDRPGQGAALAVLDDPQVLRKEREERVRAAAEEASKKLQTKRAARAKDLQRWEAAALPPGELFRGPDAASKYSAWDAAGVPTHDAAGKELSGKQRKAAEKEQRKQEEAHAKYTARLAEEPGFVDALRREIEHLDLELARLAPI